MKKFLYSRKGKAALFLIQTAAVCFTIMCVCILYLYTGIGVYDADGFSTYRINLFDTEAEYEESDYFKNMLDKQVGDIVRYAVIRNQMEVDGKFDGKKVVDIEEYYNRFELVPSDYDSIPYFIEDLIKWGQYGIEYINQNDEYEQSLYSSREESEISQVMLVAEDATDQSIGSELNQDAMKKAYETTENTELKYLTAEGWQLVERYLSAEGRGLSSYVTQDSSYDALCRYLEITAKSLSYNYSQYKNYNQIYQTNQTNLSYYITLAMPDGTRKVYTNIGAESPEAASRYITHLGRYLSYDATTMDYQTNTDIMEEDLVKEINYYNYTYAQDSQILIGIDTLYPDEDAFRAGYLAYQNIVPRIPALAACALAGILVSFGLFTLSAIVTGRRQWNGELHIQFFDRLKTELFFVLFAIVAGGMAIVGTLILAELNYFDIDKKTICTVAGIAAILIYSSVLLFLLSFIRRIKARLLWKNSILCSVCRLFRKWMRAAGKAASHFFYDTDVTIRSWLPYLIFLIGNLILVLLGIPGIVLAAVIDIFVGAYRFRENLVRDRIIRGVEAIREGELSYHVDTGGIHGENLVLAETANALGEGIRKAVETSMKDERLKADLITNVSHDIKTPLTSIINYVDLIKRENIQDEKIQSYVEILDAKSQRLKHLTEDLVEASKISSGNITLIMEHINFVELIHQSIGEFTEKLEEKGVRIITSLPDHPVMIEADSRRIWRVIENLVNNVTKYAMRDSRVYLDVRETIKEDGSAIVAMSLKNISEQPLNIEASELTERFIRGDVSRSTEGSGLGLSIAKNLTELQKGSFEIYLDGDLFKVTIEFAVIKQNC